MQAHFPQKEVEQIVQVLSLLGVAVPQAVMLLPDSRHENLSPVQISNLPAITASVRDLEAQASSSDFWDEPEKAQALLQRLTAAKDKLQQTRQLQQLLEDVQTAIELAAAEVSVCEGSEAVAVSSISLIQRFMQLHLAGAGWQRLC